MSLQRMMMYKQAAYSAQLEATMQELSNGVDSMRTFRSKLLQHYFKDVTKDAKDGHAIIHFVIPAQGTEDEYDVYIKMIPPQGTLFTQLQGILKSADKIHLLKNCDVKVFCTCKDFNYSGMKYNLKHVYDSYLPGYHTLGAPDGGEDMNPIQKDPLHKNKVCKHLIAAFKGVMSNWNSICSQAKKYKGDASSETSVFPD